VDRGFFLFSRSGWRATPQRDSTYIGITRGCFILSLDCKATVKLGEYSRGGKTRGLLKVRNYSILAHGYDPISATEWTRFAGWLQESFMPLLEREAATVGVRSVPDQLPTARCWPCQY
jgi:hypothetical protein